MLNLARPTPEGWLDRVLPHLDTVLIDHAHCEKKAAGNAINLMFRYAHLEPLLKPLSALAREELEHFDQVLDVLHARGVTFGHLQPSAYFKALRSEARRGDAQDTEALVDRLLCCALIEARSCERMKQIAEGAPDSAIRVFYADLLESEARHFSTYLHMAEVLAPRTDVKARLDELAAHESAVLDDIEVVPDTPRLHNWSGRSATR